MMNCADCKAKPSSVYCKTHSASLCAECVQNSHAQCPAILDARQLADETAQLLRVQVDELKKSPAAKEQLRQAMEGLNAGLQENAKVAAEVKKRALAEIKKCKDLSDRWFKARMAELAPDEKALAALEEQKAEIVAKKTEALETKSEDLSEIIKRYQAAEGGEVKELMKKYADIKVKAAPENSKNPLVALERKLATAFGDVPAEPQPTAAVQCGSWSVYLAKAYAAELYEWDTAKKQGRRLPLTLNGKSFVIPFGSDSVSVGGKVYIIGGSYELAKVETLCVEYSTSTARMKERKRLTTGRREHSAIYSEHDGHIYCVGGVAGARTLPECERYRESEVGSSSSEGWKSAPSLNVPRSGTTLCTVGRLLYAIAGLGVAKCENSVETLDLGEMKQWNMMKVSGGAEWTGRCGAGGIVVEYESGKDSILIFGGEDARPMDECFVLDTCSGELKALPASKLERATSFAQRKAVRIGRTGEAYIVGNEDHMFRLVAGEGEMKWEFIPAENWHPT